LSLAPVNTDSVVLQGNRRTAATCRRPSKALARRLSRLLWGHPHPEHPPRQGGGSSWQAGAAADSQSAVGLPVERRLGTQPSQELSGHDGAAQLVVWGNGGCRVAASCDLAPPYTAFVDGGREVVTVRQAVVDALRAEGVELVFALMGDANMNLICELAERGEMRIVFGRHEQGVVAMADGYARFTGRPGVATVTQGPGLTNTATSLVVAQRRRSPVLLLAGEAPLGDSDNPQGFDQIEFGRLMAGRAGRVESARSLDGLLADAFAALRSDRPYVLSLPTDVETTQLEPGWGYKRRGSVRARSIPESAPLDRAAEMLLAASRSVVLAGRGAVVGGAGDALVELATLLGAPAATTLLANGMFAGRPLDVGVAGGLGDGRALRALEGADLVLAVGASLNQWTTHFGSAITGKHLIRIDSDPDVAYDGGDELTLVGDARATVQALVSRIREHGGLPRPPRLYPLEPRDPSPYEDTDTGVDPRRFLAELDRLLPDHRSIVIGGGHVAQVACFSLRASSPLDWACTSVDFGALGQGLSTAVGACIARDGRVVHVTGDGEFMMSLSELDTAVRHSLPLTVFVLNDQAMGQERHNLLNAGQSAKFASYPSPDFAALAGGFSATGYRIDGPGDFGLLEQILQPHSGVVIVDVRINGHYLNPVSREIASHLG
jgi:acetolactate synthase I/II/III large subunit